MSKIELHKTRIILLFLIAIISLGTIIYATFPDIPVTPISLILCTATFFSSCFETGDFSEGWETELEQGSSTIDVVSTGDPFEGSFHANNIIISGSRAHVRVNPFTPDELDVWVTVHIKVDSINVDGSHFHELTMFRDIGSGLIGWAITFHPNTHNIRFYYENSGLQSFDTSYDLDDHLGEYICYEVHYIISATVGEYDFYIDEIQQTNPTGLNNNAFDPDRYYIGTIRHFQLSGDHNVFFDRILIDNVRTGCT